MARCRCRPSAMRTPTMRSPRLPTTSPPVLEQRPHHSRRGMSPTCVSRWRNDTRILAGQLHRRSRMAPNPSAARMKSGEKYDQRSANRIVAEHDMTKHIVRLPNPDGSLLLREPNHRIDNELTCAICTISANAIESDNVAVKAALLDVVDLLHQCADVHRALHVPDQERLTDVAKYLQQLCFSVTKYRLERLAIRVLFSADDLLLEGERCWKLGLIVSELLTNAARHAQFDARPPELRVELMLAGSMVKGRVRDNGS